MSKIETSQLLRELEDFKFWHDIAEEEWEIEPNTICYWFYWTPCGDECIVGRLVDDPDMGLMIFEGDEDWNLFLQLESLNPQMREWKLGSSDEEAENCILVDRKTKRIFLVPLNMIKWDPKHLLALLETLRGMNQ
mgnify:FL=1